MTPNGDRTTYPDEGSGPNNIENFLGLTSPAQDLDALIPENALQGSAYKASIDVSDLAAGSTLRITFDWQFVTDDGTSARENDFAFFVADDGIPELLANSNDGGIMTTTDVTVDGHTFTNSTGWQSKTVDLILDAGDIADGTVVMGFGVLDGHHDTNRADDSALLIDELKVEVV